MMSEDSIVVSESPAAALQLCVAALRWGRFKKIEANEPELCVTGRKRVFGQWTRSPVTLTLAPTDDGETLVTVFGEAPIQSLSGMASNPAERMVRSVIRALEEY
jgi:hypothetical protein